MEAYGHGLYMRRKNNRKLGRRPLSLCLCEIAKTTNRAEREKGKKDLRQLPSCKEGLNRRAYLRTVAAAVVDTVHAPPAIDFLHAEQFQMPTA
jgi:hypothetical protein